MFLVVTIHRSVGVLSVWLPYIKSCFIPDLNTKGSVILYALAATSVNLNAGRDAGFGVPERPLNKVVSLWRATVSIRYGVRLIQDIHCAVSDSISNVAPGPVAIKSFLLEFLPHGGVVFLNQCGRIVTVIFDVIVGTI